MILLHSLLHLRLRLPARRVSPWQQMPQGCHLQPSVRPNQLKRLPFQLCQLVTRLAIPKTESRDGQEKF